MDETNDIKLNEDLQRRIAEAKKRSFEKECQRLDDEITKRALNLVKNYEEKVAQEYKEKLQQARGERQTKENSLKKLEDEYLIKIGTIIEKRIEERRAKEEAMRIQLEEERKRQEEMARQKAEEAERLRREEEERKKLEEEKRLEEITRKQREEEIKKQEAEKRERIHILIGNAQAYFDSGDLEHALVEVAKALVNDPNNPEALELELKIKQAKESVSPKEVEPVVEKLQVKPKEQILITKPTTLEKKKKIPLPTAIIIIVGLIIITTVVLIQVTRHVFKFSKTFAVMNWTSVSGNLEENIIGSSIAEEVSTKFSSISPKPVMDYSSVYNIVKHTSTPEREIFRLGFSYLLNGRIGRNGDLYVLDLRITDSLNNVLWSSQITKQPSGFADLPGEVTQDLIKILDISLPHGETNLKISRTSTNPDAYLFYLRALELMHRQTPESLTNAYQLLLQSIQQDPKFAEGLAAAADVLAIKFEKGFARGDSIIIQAKHLAEAAITANPQLSRGFVALSKILSYEKHYNTALLLLDSASTFNVNHSNIELERGKILIKIGKYNDALDALNRAFRLNPYDVDLLQTYANTYQLIGLPKQGIQYHELAIKVSDDSLSYLSGPISDAILVDPELRLTWNQRIINACKQRSIYAPNDYINLYNLGRLKQVMGHTDADDILNQLVDILREKIRENPKDVDAFSYLALTLTRLGRFSEASFLTDKCMGMDPSNSDLKYRTARMYTIQMYSQKEKKYDEQKKEQAIKYMKQAIELNYSIGELVNADFYNMFQRPEYVTIIKDQKR